MSYLEIVRNVLALEAEAMDLASKRLKVNEVTDMVNIYSFLHEVGGNLIFCGVGKSGIIAQKLSATFTSLGLSSFFLHPIEALHGDLGRVKESDAIVFISKSGTANEIIKLMPFLEIDKRMKVGILGDIKSPLAKCCSVVFDCSVKKEACINNQAPTTSSTLALAMGDALAVLYENWVGLSKEKFAINHPGGILGKSLRLKVSDLMWKYEDCPIVEENASLQDVILEMTRRPTGACAIVDERRHLLGLFVEGDIRRAFTLKDQTLESKVFPLMTKNPIKIGPSELAFEAWKLMENRDKGMYIVIPVVDDENRFMGMIRFQELFKEGFSCNL